MKLTIELTGSKFFDSLTKAAADVVTKVVEIKTTAEVAKAQAEAATPTGDGRSRARS